MLLSDIKINQLMESDCAAMRETFDRVGDRWSLYILWQLHDGPVRFNQLKREVLGISQRMLTLTLRSLERDGLISRAVFPTNPPTVEYALTERGQSLLQPVIALVAWSETHRAGVLASRIAFDKEQDVGQGKTNPIDIVKH